MFCSIDNPCFKKVSNSLSTSFNRFSLSYNPWTWAVCVFDFHKYMRDPIVSLFRDGGSIILTASVGGSKGIEGFTVYDATKAAIRSFARSCTIDLKRRIRDMPDQSKQKMKMRGYSIGL